MFDFKNASKKELRKEYRRIAQTRGRANTRVTSRQIRQVL